MAKAKTASATITGLTFSGDMTFAIKADAAKLSDPTTKAVASQPVKVHAEGGISKPGNADVTLSVAAGGQNLTMGAKATGNKAWVEFADQWYLVPPSQLKKVTSQTGGSPDQALSKLGIDPTTWTGSSTVTTEQLDGKSVYHVVTKADTQALMSDLVKALTTAAGADATAGQLLQQNGKQLQELEQSLKSAQAEYWIDSQTFYIVKGSVTANMTFTGDIAAQGLQGADVSVTYTASDFNQPVEVTPPPSALPFKQLQKNLGQLVPSVSGTGL
jgi:hypothetical protein